MMYIRPFYAKGPTVSVAVNVASAQTAITNAGVGTQSIRLVNVGTTVAFFKLGKDSTVTAALTDTPLLPNSEKVFLLPNDMTNIAVISASAGGTLYATTGESV